MRNKHALIAFLAISFNVCFSQEENYLQFEGANIVFQAFQDSTLKFSADEISFAADNFISEAYNSDTSYIDHWLIEFYNYGVEKYAKDGDRVIAAFTGLAKYNWVFEDDSVNDRMGRTLNILGTCLRIKNRIPEGLEMFNLSLVYFKKTSKLDLNVLPSMYSNIGNIYIDIGDFSKANIYLLEGERLSEENLRKSSIEPKDSISINRSLASIKLNKGFVLYSMGYRRDARDHYLEALVLAEEYNPRIVTVIQGNMGITLEALGEYQDAIVFYKDAIESSRNSDFQSFMSNSVNLQSVYSKTLNITEFYRGLNDIRKLLIENIEFTNFPRFLSNTYIQEAQINETQNNHKKSIDNLSKALRVVDPEIQIYSDKISFPQSHKLNDPYLSIEIINLLSKSKSEIGIKENKPEHLIYSLNYLKQSEQLIDSLRSVLETQESKLILNQRQKETYGAKADLCKLLYDLTENKEYQYELFLTCEKGKSAGLWSEIQEMELKTDHISDSLLFQEHKLKDSIAQIETRIASYKEKTEQESDKDLSELQANKFALNERLDQLIQQFNKDSTEYYKGKFSREFNNILTANELQGLLSNNQAFIEFYFSEKILHQVVITKENIESHSIANPDSLITIANSLMQQLKGQRHSYRQEDTEKYLTDAHSLYHLLFNNIQEKVKTRDLIISGDGVLNLLPFEALVVNDSLANHYDFRDLSYLIYQHNINYTNTATLWAYKENESNKSVNLVLAFAPVYDQSNSYDYSELYSEDLQPLPGTLDEINFIQKNFKSKTFTNSEATESSFKKGFKDAGILHLAMHTIINNDNPLQTFLVFDSQDDIVEDGKLTASEILNYRLNAKLAVLSACNTGAGEIREGEGIMGLARSFIQAGCKNLVINLWAMDDNFGKSIIKHFYTGLDDGKSISNSLRDAKLQHLKEARKLEAHPHYWAGIVLQGHDTIIEMPKKRSFLWPVSILILIGMGIIAYQVKKK